MFEFKCVSKSNDNFSIQFFQENFSYSVFYKEILNLDNLLVADSLNGK